MAIDHAETLTVRCVPAGHTFTVAGEEALPPSARATAEARVYEVADQIDCPECNPPEQMPDR